MQSQANQQLSRYGQPATLILIALLDGPNHGYALMSAIEVQMDFKVGPGTFYAAIAKLLQDGLIRRISGEERVKCYEITSEGRDAVADFLNRWSGVIQLGQSRLA